MPTKTKTARNKDQSPTFRRALQAAKKRLDDAMQERALAQSTVKQLDIEIPNLEATIRSLTAQLHPTSSVGLAPSTTSHPPLFVVNQRPGDGKPYRMEVEDSMSSIPAPVSSVDDAVEDPNETPDLDTIPMFAGNNFV